MSQIPDDEPTIVPPRRRDGVASAAITTGTTGLGGGSTLPLGTRLGEFEITGLVGEGGFGIVYLAHDHILGRNVALKEYMPSSLAARGEGPTVVVRAARYEEPFQAGLRSFINEARLLARFDHPSLVKVYRFWGENSTAYMVMPFYEGITLKVMLKNRGQRPDELWLKDLLRPLSDALELLHRDHCFHRDIAPDNILMLEGTRPLLLDFGAARRVIGDLTHELTAILKPGYAPVEQYAEVSSMKQGAWTDIYALASVVYFAIMGKAPEPSVARLIADPMVPLAVAAAGRYSAEFLHGIDQALRVKPQDRPQSIAELRVLIGLGDRRRRTSAPLPSARDADATTVAIAAPPARSPPAPAAAAPARPVSAAQAPARSQPPAAVGESAVQAPAQSPPSVVVAETVAPVARRINARPLVIRAGLALVVLLLIGAAAYLIARPQPEAPSVVEPPRDPAAPSSAPGTTAPAVDRPTPSTTVATPPPPVDPAPARSPPAEPAATQPQRTKPAADRVKPAAAGDEPNPSTKIGNKAECVDILQRASLGEPLSPAERATLKEHCR